MHSCSEIAASLINYFKENYSEEWTAMKEDQVANKGYTHIFINLLLRCSASFYRNPKNGKQEDIWTNSMNKKNCYAIMNTVLISKEVRNIILSMPKLINLYKLTGIIHLEHLTPCSQSIKDILNDVDPLKVFLYNKCGYITKLESKILDGPGSVITKEDIELAKNLFSEFTKDEIDYDSYLGKPAKSSGNCFVRIAKLMLNGVVFVNFKTGDTLTAEEIYNKVISNDFILDYNY